MSVKKYIPNVFKKYQALTIVLCIGTIISIIAFNITLETNIEKLEENFRSDAKVKTLLLENQFEKDLRELELLADLFTFKSNLVKTQIKPLLSDIVKHNTFTTILWVKNKKSSIEDYEISVYEPGDSLKRNYEFTPILKKEIIEAIIHASKIKKPVTSDLFSFNKNNNHDISFVYPAYNSIDNSVKGFIIGIINLEEFFENTFRWKNYVTNSLIKIFDRKLGHDEINLIYNSGEKTNLSTQNSENFTIKNVIGINSSFYFISSINLPNREWKILFTPIKFHIEEEINSLMAFVILICGMLITVLIGSFCFYIIDRHNEIEKLVRERTTELELAKKDVEENQQRLSTVFNNLVEGILIIDMRGIIIDSNLASEKMFGYERSELISANISFLLTNDLDNEYNLYLKKLLRSIKNNIKEQGKELIAKQKNGLVFPIEVGISTVKTSGQIIFIAIIRDITHRKNDERKLALYAKELENERNKADLANNAKSEFLANMSHEIRTPMNGIIGMTELLLDTKLSNEQLEYLHTIHSSGNMLLTIINDILDLSKIEAGQLTLDRLEICLPDLIIETIQLLSFRANENNLTLLLDYHPSIPFYIIADPLRLRQILINLIGNAIKFSKESYVLIKVTFNKFMNKTAELLFEIEDNGIGIDISKLDSIFSNFTQADESTTRKFGGTGLGLAICKKIVKLMNGQIGATSKLGIGSLFWFMIKVNIPKHNLEEFDILITKMKDKRILFIFEDTNILSNKLENIISKDLNYFDINHIFTDSISEAQNIINNNKIDFVIIYSYSNDKIIKFSRSVKNNSKFNHIKLIYIIKIGCENISSEEFNFDSYITKPIYAQILFEAMRDSENKNAKNQEDSFYSIKNSIIPQFNVKLLVVEDYPPNQRLAKKMLEKLGCIVEVANGGEKALELIENNEYDIIFMDCQMPDMDGYEATMQIRKSEKSKKIIIIAMTANALTGDKQKCLDSGMDDYIAKPMKHHDLEKMLMKWVEVREDFSIY